MGKQNSQTDRSEPSDHIIEFLQNQISDDKKLHHLTSSEWTHKFKLIPEDQDYITSCDPTLKFDRQASKVEIIY